MFDLQLIDESGRLANVSRHDHLPFGEELTGQIGGRTTQQGYTGDTFSILAQGLTIKPLMRKLGELPADTG